MDLIHDFYIIESVGDNDIKDGHIFFQSLEAISKVPIYESVKDIQQFKNALRNFIDSRYKYLFISSHGDEENIELTDETLNSYDLEDFKINFDERRIFMSTCRGGSYLFAKYFIRNGAYSIIGTPDELDQIVAVGMWPTMLIIFERMSETVLKFGELNTALKLMVDLYRIPLHYYSFIRDKKQMKEYIYIHKEKRIRNDYPL